MAVLLKSMCLVLIAAFLAANTAEAAAAKCSHVESFLMDCKEYVTGTSSVLPPYSRCCSSVDGLNNAAKNTKERQAACNCLKQSVSIDPKIKLKSVAAVLKTCQAIIPHNIGPNTDCSKVK